jgi:DNA-binding response OmpR family regulator
VQSILIVEDDPSIRLGLEKNHKFEGYHVVTADDGEKGLEIALNQPGLDLLVLDVMLPGVNGYEICRILRKQNVNTPILMLTAKSQEIDKIMGFELGADDYITKPFSVRELVARIGAHLRRTKSLAGEASGVYRFGRYTLDFDGQTLLYARAGKPEGTDPESIELSAKEFQLLKYLIQNEGKVLSREQILNKVWGFDYYGTARTVDNFINKLRGKIEQDKNDPVFIVTMRGSGYKFQRPAEA